ncbi:MAG: DUF4214 domain-containing protein [Gemmatimonadaceae bacterium]|nr:DUF4214 domain-containing protein [Acetobacteraceae bacterium]
MPTNVFLFAANDSVIGSELWVSDMTPDGTVLLKDINFGTGGSSPTEFTPLGNGRAIFTANDGVAGAELWATDGTATGTVLVSDIRLGAMSSAPTGYAALGDGKALFQANDGVNGLELWITDGTPGGTSLIRNIATGLINSVPNGFTPIGNSRFVFAANDSVSGAELWITDGTGTGTKLVSDLFAAGTSGSNPAQFTRLRDGLVLFSAIDPSRGSELWATDGTKAGTVVLTDINPGISSAKVIGLKVLSTGKAVFLADNGTVGTELWITDGTAAGTMLVKDIQPGLPSAFNQSLTGLVELGGGRFVFAADAGLSGAELWVSDGTAAGTIQVRDIVVGEDGSDPYGFRALGNGRVVFTAIHPIKGPQPWVTDGTVAGTMLLQDLSYPLPGKVLSEAIKTNDPYFLTSIGNGKAVFRAASGVAGRELWITDGTSAGTVLLKDIAPKAAHSDPMNFAPLTISGVVPRTTTPVRFTGLVTDTLSNTLYIGGDGTDVVVLGEALRQTTFSTFANGDVELTRGVQADIIRGVEQLRFLDGRMVYDPADPAAQVVRLYQAGLGRAPDQAGLNFWIGNVQRGVPLADLATAFLTSPEFVGRFGSGLSNQGFVIRVYENVLGRAPDPAGLQFWTGGLDRGASTRGATLAGISESGENKGVTKALVDSGIWDVNETAQQVARLYDTALGRLPDSAGLGFWTAAIDSGRSKLLDLAQSFVTSAEFAQTYGPLNNRDFVAAVYTNTLGRPGDAAGVEFWTNALNAGTSRASVTIGFSESAEHQIRTAANVGGETPSGFGVRLA